MYYGTGGEAWNDNADWLGNGDHCSWNGRIHCNTDGLVFVLILNSINLIGAVPDLNLPALLRLALHYNPLVSVIPDFSNLQALQELNLSGNALSVVPNFNLPALQALHLYSTALTEVPNFNLPALSYLNLSNNAALSVIPNFSDLTALEYLNLNGNPLLTSIPQSLCDSRDVGLISDAEDRDVGLIIDAEDPLLQTCNLSTIPCAIENREFCDIVTDALGGAFTNYAEAVTWFIEVMNHPDTMTSAQLEVRICI